MRQKFARDICGSIGRQCGNIPLILSGGMRPENDEQQAWLNRTRTGVCLVHEIRVWDWQPKEMWATYRKLFDFGYGGPDCRVYNYWDEGFPLRVAGADTRALVLVRGEKAVAVITDYGEGGAARATLDLKALGLPATVKATDLETGAELAAPAPGEVDFALRKHDYKVVLWQ